MKKKLFDIFFLYTLLGILLASCGQDYNSNSGDADQYMPITGIDSSTPEGARFLAAYKVYQGKCFGCHAWAAYKTPEQWVNAALVVPGSLETSNVYTYLKNVGGNMPPDPISRLSTQEINTVVAWINGLQ